MKLPKVFKGKKILKVLNKEGFEEKSRRGSHISLSNGEVHVTIVMPVTTIGVVKKISRITGIPAKEFL